MKGIFASRAEKVRAARRLVSMHLIGAWFQAPFSSFAAGIASKMRRTWHSGHVKTDAPLRSCLLYVAYAYAEWGPHP